MFRSILITVASMLLVLGVTLPLHADYPSPSPYPVSWELDLTYQLPRRIQVYRQRTQGVLVHHLSRHQQYGSGQGDVLPVIRHADGCRKRSSQRQ